MMRIAYRMFSQEKTCAVALVLLALALVLGVLKPGLMQAPAQAEVQSERVLREHIAEVFSKYCTECHQGPKPKGGVGLGTLTETQWSDDDLIDDLLAAVELGDMPPKNAKAPLPDQARRDLVTKLQSQLAALEANQQPGTLNRLTRSEWCDTLEDLTGLPVEKPYELPIDSTQAMARVGEHQLLTPMAVRQYQVVAERYIDEAILADPAEAKTRTVDLTKSENQIGNTKQEAQPWGITSHNDGTRITLNTPVKSFADEGVYEFVFDYYFAKGEPLAKEFRRQFAVTGQAPEPVENVDPNKHFGRFNTGGEILSRVYTHDLDGEKLHPSGKWKFYRYDQPLLVRLSRDTKFVQFGVSGNGENNRWVFRGVTIRGPLNKADPPSHAKIFGNAKRGDDLDTCKQVLDRLATRLFRRPVDAQLMEPYYQMAAAKYDTGANLYAATESCLKAMVVSPYFLFKDMPDGPKLNDYMIATRLSYFLNNTGPDDRLMELAATGKLSDPAVRRAEAKRLLDDAEKSDRFVRLFTRQWLGLDLFGDFAPNEAYKGHHFDSRVRPSIEEQPFAFFDEVLRHNLSARNFIHSDFVLWDPELEKHSNNRKATGINPHEIKFKEHGFTRVDLSGAPEEQRMRLGGLVSMPIIMCMTTDGETTQPYLRGAWVVKQLMGMHLEPPDTVPAIEVNLENVDKPKEILRLHKQDPNCYVCHVKMDYIGLALENYDVVGRYQTNYLFPIIEGKKFALVTKGPVDSLAETPDGDPMDGVAGLKAHMFDREGEIMRHIMQRLFAYAIGREPRLADRDAIDALLASAKLNDYKLRDMILELVASDSFTQR